MTGRELIQWIRDNKAEDAKVEVQYRDDGGVYCGTDTDIKPMIIKAGEKLQYAECTEFDRVVL